MSIRKYQQQLREHFKKVTSSGEETRAFLQRARILTKKGKLTKRYRP